MKRVTVRFFAAFREAAGIEAEQVETNASSVAELFAELCDRHAGLARETNALVAINDEMTRWDAGFEAGDEILYFPPVAGG